MDKKPARVVVDAASIEPVGVQIPGASPGGVDGQLLNVDLERGLVATIIHFRPGTEIPAHFHERMAESHFVLEGELIDAGRPLGPGAYLTHAAGVVHGPHHSPSGCKVLTVQGVRLESADIDFHLVVTLQDVNGETAGADAIREADPQPPPDMLHEPVALADLPETQKTAPTPDNPTNPATS